MKILINKIEPILRSDHTQFSGKREDGSFWYLWQVNKEYSFYSGNEKVPLKIGQEYEFNIREKEFNGRITKILVLTKGAIKESNDTIKILKTILLKLEAIENTSDKINLNVSLIENTIRDRTMELEKMKKNFEDWKNNLSEDEKNKFEYMFGK